MRRGNASPAFAAPAPSLSELIASGVVHDIGAVIAVDSEGHPVSKRPVLSFKGRAIWRARVERAVHWLTPEASNETTADAIYLRGSVALGSAFDDGRSDIDLVFVISDPARKLAVERAVRRRAQSAPWHSPHERRVDVGVIVASDVSAGLFPLWAFGLLLRGETKRPVTGALVAPRNTLAADIRWQARRTCLALKKTPERDTLVTWFAKRSLRAVMELSCRQAGYYSRDLVPCCRAAVAVYPQYAQVWIDLLVLACRAQESPKTQTTKIWNAAEIVEELELTSTYGPSAAIGAYKLSEIVDQLTVLPKRSLFPVNTFSLSFWKTGVKLPSGFEVIEDPLPKHALHRFRDVHEADILQQPDVIHFHASQNIPTVFRAAAQDFCARRAHASTPQSLFTERGTGVVRVSPDATFVFSKPLPADSLITPHSVTREMQMSEFILRCGRQRQDLPPLYYGQEERVYLQSPVRKKGDCFLTNLLVDFPTAQIERRWISTAGSATSLHFDASASALLQIFGQKEFIFFPPDALPWAGPFPVGHPMGRRSRVDLARPGSPIFEKFWSTYSDTALKVILRPGDILIWPAGWLHYVTSLTFSVSQTYRFVNENRVRLQ